MKKLKNTPIIYSHLKLIVKKREKIIKYLKLKGIDTNIHYPYSLPKLKFFKLKNSKTHSPIANKISSELLSLPIYPELDDKSVMYTAKILNEALKS